MKRGIITIVILIQGLVFASMAGHARENVCCGSMVCGAALSCCAPDSERGSPLPEASGEGRATVGFVTGLTASGAPVSGLLGDDLTVKFENCTGHAPPIFLTKSALLI